MDNIIIKRNFPFHYQEKGVFLHYGWGGWLMGDEGVETPSHKDSGDTSKQPLN